MRNLKRALSLTLASVMLLGMMVVGSSAASYPDVEDTHNVEAIEVLQAIKVMVGDDNGNFGPDDQVNRAQMAVVMALLLDLDYDYYKGTNPFWDVPSWAEPYVAACYANGIVSGYNATTYGAGDPVTAVQAASMMMRALGYFQHQTDYRDGFELSTVRQASKISLFKDVNAAGNNAALTRNQVAQLALNTLRTPMVEGKDNTLNINTGSNAGNISITGGSMDYVYATSKDPKFCTAIDSIEASSVGSQNDGYLVELGEKLYNGELELEKNDVDSFGRPANTWTYKNTKVGTYAHRGELIATFDGKVAKEDIYALLSATVRSSLEDTDSDSGKLTVTVDGYANAAVGGRAKGNTNGDDNWYKKNDSSAIYTYKGRNHNDNDYGSSRKGTLTEVYLDEDKNVDIAIINTYVYQATSDYNSSRDEVRMATVGDTNVDLIANGLVLSGEDFAIQGVKADDYLLVTVASDDGSDYEVQSVAVAEKLEGEVTAYAVGDTVTIDGTKYNYSAICGKDSGTAREKVRSTTYTVGQPAIVVLDKYNNIIAVDQAVASSNFVFVSEFGKDGNLDSVAKARMYFTDGTKETGLVDRVDWEGTTLKDADDIDDIGVANTWFTYSKASDGKYTLYAVPGRYKAGNAGKGAGNVLTINGKVAFLKSNANALANENTIMIMVDNEGDMVRYEGTSQIPDITTTSNNKVYYLMDSDGYVDYAFVDLKGQGATVIDGGEDSFLYVLKFNNEVKAGSNDSTFEYATIEHETGSVKPLNFDKGVGAGDLKDGNSANLPHVGDSSDVKRAAKGGVYSLFYKPRTNNDDEISSFQVVPNNEKYFNNAVTNATVAYSGRSLVFKTASGDRYIVNDNSKLHVIARKGTNGVMKDPTKDYEIFENATGADLESTLFNKTFSGLLQGVKISDDSDVVSALYVTVDTVTAYDFDTVSVDKTEVTIAANAGTAVIKVGSTSDATSAPYSVKAEIDDTAVATVDTTTAANMTGSAGAWNKDVTVTGVAKGTATVTITVKHLASGAEKVYTVFVNENGVKALKSLSVTGTLAGDATKPKFKTNGDLSTAADVLKGMTVKGVYTDGTTDDIALSACTLAATKGEDHTAGWEDTYPESGTHEISVTSATKVAYVTIPVAPREDTFNMSNNASWDTVGDVSIAFTTGSVGAKASAVTASGTDAGKLNVALSSDKSKITISLKTGETWTTGNTVTIAIDGVLEDGVTAMTQKTITLTHS